MPGPYVPPGYSPPFQVVDDLHHGAWVIIVVALGLVLSLVSFLIRLYVRLALHPPLGKDDYVLLGATIIAVVQATLIFEACAKGLGTSIDLLDEGDVNIIQVLIITSDILYLITLYTTKCCVVGIYLRLTPQKTHNRASWATLLLCTLWVVPAILILSVNCGLNRPWKGTGGQCENLLPRWQFIVALDITTELILFGLAVFLLAGLFMPVKRKFTIAFAFIFRLPMIVFAILHIYYLHQSLTSPDPTLDAVPSLIWGQVELNYALVACSVFCMRPFIAAVSTNYGRGGDSTLESSRDKSSGSNSKSTGGSGGGSKGGTETIGNETAMLGNSDRRAGTARAKVERGNGMIGRGSAGTDEIELVDWTQGRRWSEGSGKMIIRKDVQYTVEFDGVESSSKNLHHESEYWDQYLGGQRP
ncbi:uncharacterized protein ANIA_02044 [Aspergillus nidulans FGSC A4]|uniref:Rhodopsin domain-containing protein n=1 Tax=Emericella nidulans (strain FGSC A4 / ATCC 38163 / CBS 112.46 / NRRL 194 / M139) TaxID=227321 RepID=C8VLM0_EMENI|nr:hypothetical protein [Aspergillus nidulans FGSC A4]CBF86070.1 TPA: conserved hypothetical protein [Aspergillus nidulans FGSC A4]